MIKEKVTIIVKGFVEIHNVDKYFEQILKQAFSIENPAWHKLVKMKVGGAQFGWGRFFEHYIKVKNQNLIMIGRGGLKKLLDLCKANGYEVGLRDGTVKVPLKNEFKGRLELRDYQKDIPELITKSNGILKLDTGFGKAQPIDTLIPTENGFTKIGDLRIGDSVLNPDGNSTTIVGVFPQGIIPTYKITFSDGTSTECCENHIWSVQVKSDKHRRKGFKNITTKDLINNLKYSNGDYKWFLPITKPLKFSKKNLPLDPYLVGALIGDGSITCHLQFINPDKGVLDKVRNKVKEIKGHTIENPSKDNLTYNIKSNQHKGTGKIKRLLKELGLLGKKSYEKRIPKEYLRGSLNQRIELLRGLMDTDGTIDYKSKSCSYSTSSKGLCKDVVELAQSLGGVPTVYIKKSFYKKDGIRKYCRDSYRIRISIPLNPFSLSRKADMWLENPKQGRTRAIESIKYIGKKESVCIKVANNNGLYLTNDFIVTHNTLIALKLIEKYQQKTLIVVPRTHLLENYLTEIGKYYDVRPGRLQGVYNLVGNEMTITTIQTLQSLLKKGELEKYRNTFGMIIADEVQGYVTLKARKVFGSFNAHYLFGLSATPERSDGQGDAIFLTFGDILVERKLERSLPKVKVILTNSPIPVREYPDMVEYMVNDINRNSLIVDTTIEQVRRRRRVMILTKRVDHIKNLVSGFNGKGIKVIPFYSTKTKDNNKIFKELKENNQEFDVLIGTFSLLGTGSDVPNLDTLAIAGDLVSGVLTKQSVGRCTRLFEGKQDPLILDFYDNQNIVFHRQHKHRCQLYADNGWQVGQ